MNNLREQPNLVNARISQYLNNSTLHPNSLIIFLSFPIDNYPLAIKTSLLLSHVHFFQMTPNTLEDDLCNNRRNSITDLLADFLSTEDVVVRKALQGSQLSVGQSSLATGVTAAFSSISCDAVSD